MTVLGPKSGHCAPLTLIIPRLFLRVPTGNDPVGPVDGFFLAFNFVVPFWVFGFFEDGWEGVGFFRAGNV
jgi:hypothetical protein